MQFHFDIENTKNLSIEYQWNVKKGTVPSKQAQDIYKYM